MWVGSTCSILTAISFSQSQVSPGFSVTRPEKMARITSPSVTLMRLGGSSTATSSADRVFNNVVCATAGSSADAPSAADADRTVRRVTENLDIFTSLNEITRNGPVEVAGADTPVALPGIEFSVQKKILASCSHYNACSRAY